MPAPRLRPLASALAALALAVGGYAAFPADPPNDPLYAQDPACPPGGPALPQPECNSPSGQWNLFGFWFNNAPDPGHASGISADLAWQTTTGRRDTVVVVLDTGVNYDHQDLAGKIWLNCGELPAPQDAGGLTLAGSSPGCLEPGLEYDLDGDGFFNVDDYADDARVPDSVALAGKTRGDLRPVENGVDDDGNGFIDDISGWDARDGDGDEYRTNGDGHGTGRNGFIAAETDNGAGIAGICPECSLANVRVDGTFVPRTEGPAIGAIWAADHGHEVINMALGATAASSMTRAAFDYFTRKNGLALNASANEFSFHHNFQTVFDDVMAIGAVAPDFDTNANATTTYLRKANFSNYGAHLDVVAPTTAPTTGGGNTSYGDSSGTSSAVPHAAGVAGLVYSRARELIELGLLDTTGLALADISAQEVRQILNRSADDIVQTDDPAGVALYPLSPGWDRWTGYGRINAAAAVAMVDGAIPPEADIDRPDWYRKVGRDDPVVDVEFYANARWESSFDWVLEVGAGIEPAAFAAIASGSGEPADPGLSSADLASNFSEPWDTTGLAEGFYTLRLRVGDDQGNLGEDRMGIWVQRADPDDHAGWPRTVAGVNAGHPTSLDSISSALVDLDGDNTLEIVFSSGDGQIHALRHDGTNLPGWPVRTDDVAALPLGASEAFDGDPANGEVIVSGSSVVGGVSVADLDGDAVLEVCAGAYNGRVYCWDAAGNLEPGFPVETDPGQTRDQYPPHAFTANARGEAVLAPPTLADLDGDGTLELISGAFDQQMYVWNHDGSRFGPWPLPIGSVNAQRPAEIISSPLVADIDADGVLELVFGTNETSEEFGSGSDDAGLLYAFEPDGTLEPGWPAAVGPSPSPGAVPLVATGVGTSPVAADIDGPADPAGDGHLEIAVGVLLSPPLVFNHDGSLFQTMSSASGSVGPGSDLDEETPEGGLGSEPALHYVAFGAFADVEGDGLLDYVNGTLGGGIASSAAGAGALADFDQYLSVWGAADGQHKAAFPRVMEDWQFFTGPAVADLDGGADGVHEVIASSGGFFVHAFHGVTGLNAAGFPKNVGHWVVSSPLVGDIDADGALELVVMTRLGDAHVWDMAGDACLTALGGSSAPWRKALHDEWGTGVLGTDTLRPAALDGAQVMIDPPSGQIDFPGVGDDGHCGASDAYEVRTVAGSSTDWTAGATALTAPGSSDGAPVSLNIGPIALDTTVMIRASDEVGNGSAVFTRYLPEPAGALGLAAAAGWLALLARRRRVSR